MRAVDGKQAQQRVRRNNPLENHYGQGRPELFLADPFPLHRSALHPKGREGGRQQPITEHIHEPRHLQPPALAWCLPTTVASCGESAGSLMPGEKKGAVGLA